MKERQYSYEERPELDRKGKRIVLYRLDIPLESIDEKAEEPCLCEGTDCQKKYLEICFSGERDSVYVGGIPGFRCVTIDENGEECGIEWFHRESDEQAMELMAMHFEENGDVKMAEKMRTPGFIPNWDSFLGLSKK